MALQESPELQSACIYLERGENGKFEGYINAFERKLNAKWYVSYLPTHIAHKIQLQ